MATEYSLQIYNETSQSQGFVLFQKPPETGMSQLMSLAWFTKTVPASGNATFIWTQDYQAVAGQTGTLTPGARFFPDSVQAMELASNNVVQADEVNGQLTLAPAQSGGMPGSLTIEEAATIQINKSAVGLNMKGVSASTLGIYVAAAEPNMTITVTPGYEYWVGTGTYATGEVLDPNAMPNAVPVVFAATQTSQKVTLQVDGTWATAAP